jgi:tetratricopeptide (TPR) repeat protein
MSVIWGIEIFGPLIEAHGEGGQVVSTASIFGLIAGGSPQYDVTKYGVVALSEGLRVNKRSKLTPPSLGRSMAWLADRRRDPMPINTHAISWLTGEHDVALAAIGRALHSNPNSFDVLIRSGWVRVWTANFDLAAEHFLRCVRLNPIDPLLGYAYCGLAFTYNLKGAYEKGAEYARLTANNMPGWIFGWIHLAISSADLGNLQEARAAVSRILDLNPSFVVKQHSLITSSKHDWMLEKAIHGLRLAGLPD